MIYLLYISTKILVNMITVKEKRFDILATISDIQLQERLIPILLDNNHQLNNIDNHSSLMELNVNLKLQQISDIQIQNEKRISFEKYKENVSIIHSLLELRIQNEKLKFMIILMVYHHKINMRILKYITVTF